MSFHARFVCHATAIAAFTFALAGCSGILPKKEPLQIFTPQVHVDPDPAWPKVDWQLTVVYPRSNGMIDSRRMLVSPTPGQIQVYDGAAWNDNVPDFVQNTIVNAFEDSGKIIATGRQSSGLHADFQLQMELRDDQAVYRTPAGPPEIEITITASLIDYTTNRAVQSHTFRKVVPARATDIASVAQAFNTGLGSITHDIVGWTLTTGEQAYRATKDAAKR